MLKLSFIADR